jgi:copper oxidase (laccase) domain-containing protein
MIQPRQGVAFSEADDGDLRHDVAARHALARRLAISPHWATLGQVHGGRVVEVSGPGDQGEADAMFTRVGGLPLAVFTADCAGVVVHGAGGVGVAHAGWRGAIAGVVAALFEAMTAAGAPPRHAFLGPTIGPCCFEVGDEVAARFPGDRSFTTWGTGSVDLPGALLRQLGDLPVWQDGRCPYEDGRLFSHRRGRSIERMAALGWLP